jgi:hypothetical protein
MDASRSYYAVTTQILTPRYQLCLEHKDLFFRQTPFPVTWLGGDLQFSPWRIHERGRKDGFNSLIIVGRWPNHRIIGSTVSKTDQATSTNLCRLILPNDERSILSRLSPEYSSCRCSVHWPVKPERAKRPCDRHVYNTAIGTSVFAHGLITLNTHPALRLEKHKEKNLGMETPPPPPPPREMSPFN